MGMLLGTGGTEKTVMEIKAKGRTERSSPGGEAMRREEDS